MIRIQLNINAPFIVSVLL
ncbi:hypothetical protein Godav_010653 [Gossypium davidsonii]|uniref:Uncharacterized protein n=1 Tax=Gossypium davidsonii TaxID=34287 RepID=A0A7J8SHB3_GOSDV|nr:hypothetical protein [Gossypium davidsonii]